MQRAKPRVWHLDDLVLGSGAAPVWLPVMELENRALVVASMLLELQTTDSMKESETVPAKAMVPAKAVAILEMAQADSSVSLCSASQAKGK